MPLPALPHLADNSEKSLQTDPPVIINSPRKPRDYCLKSHLNYAHRVVNLPVKMPGPARYHQNANHSAVYCLNPFY